MRATMLETGPSEVEDAQYNQKRASHTPKIEESIGVFSIALVQNNDKET